VANASAASASFRVFSVSFPCFFRVFSVSFPCLFRVIPWQMLLLLSLLLSVANLLLSCNFRPNMDILEML